MKIQRGGEGQKIKSTQQRKFDKRIVRAFLHANGINKIRNGLLLLIFI